MGRHPIKDSILAKARAKGKLVKVEDADWDMKIFNEICPGCGSQLRWKLENLVVYFVCEPCDFTFLPIGMFGAWKVET